ncbi:MAG: toxin-antitoxin system YwqK family antitoxin [Shewanella sp.]
MSLFRAFKAKLFNAKENSCAHQDIPLQSSPNPATLPSSTFKPYFSLAIQATPAQASHSETNDNCTRYYFDSPQTIELLGWEQEHESCIFHDTQFDRIEIHGPVQYFYLGQDKSCSLEQDADADTSQARWQVALVNLQELVICRFYVDEDYRVQGDMQDFGSLTGKLQRTFHQIETEQGQNLLRIVTQSPNITQAVDSNYFGERNGITRQFNALGVLQFEGNFINDQQLGRQTWYDHEGKINQVEERQLDGMLLTYYHSNGQIKETAEKDSEGNYINQLKRYYESGNLWLTRPMVANHIHGIEYMYYEDGKLQAELTHDMGKPVNELWYHPNGNLKQEVHFNQVGKRIETYYEDGQLAWRVQLNSQGVNEGLRQEWHPNGVLAKQLNFSNGIAHGNSEQWYPNGQLEQCIPFENGHEQGLATWYHENGQLALEIYLEKGLREGLFRSYYESGVLSAEGQYQHNLSIAPFIEYYENQQVQMYLPHTQGNRDGTARWFYEDGTIKTIAEYVVRDGQGYLKERSSYNKQGVLECFESHSNTRCGYHLEDNQREYYQIGHPDTRIEYYEDGAIRWLLTRLEENLFSSKTFLKQGGLLESGFVKVIDNDYQDVGHWQRFTQQGQLQREAWLSDDGELKETRHYFDAAEQEQTIAAETKVDDNKLIVEAMARSNDTKEPQSSTLILSYHLKFDPDSQLYAMKRYHPNRKIAEEGNLVFQGQEHFWVGIHNQYDKQGRLELSETYTMSGEPIEQSSGSNHRVLN